MCDEEVRIVGGTKDQAVEIASLIMEAMDYDCCLHFAGPEHSLDDFHRMMTDLVRMDDSQYSYRNTLVAMTGGEIAGILVGYDGKELRKLRVRFVEKTQEYFGRDFSGMEDETTKGEYYLDSLCVKSAFRKHGIATRLIGEAIRRYGSQPVGLLVDHTHPWAERLYRAIGFEFVNATMWGGHAMNHLQYFKG